MRAHGRVAVLGSVALLQAACLIHDPIHTAKNVMVYTEKVMELRALQQQDDLWRRMGRTLDLFFPLARFGMPGAPLLRTRWPDDLGPAARAYVDAINGGDATGAGYAAVTRPLYPVAPDLSTLGPLTPETQARVRLWLGGIQTADAMNASATDVAGRARGARRAYREALGHLEAGITQPTYLTQTVAHVSAGINMHAQVTQMNNEIALASQQQAILETLQDREATAGGVAFQAGQLATTPRGGLTTPVDWRLR